MRVGLGAPTPSGFRGGLEAGSPQVRGGLLYFGALLSRFHSKLPVSLGGGDGLDALVRSLHGTLWTGQMSQACGLSLLTFLPSESNALKDCFLERLPGWLGWSVEHQTLDFSSGHDPTVMGLSPKSGLGILTLCLPFFPLVHALSLSLSPQK